MSKLSELIDQLCPDGVEFRPLEKCCEVLDNKRKPITKSAREAGEFPYYGANGVQDYVAGYIFDGVYVLVGEDGSVMTPNGNPVVNWAEGKIWVNNHAHIISEAKGVLLRYLFHYLQTVNVKPLIHGNIPKLTGGDFRALQIPVPPLPVQSEIVRILDNFTELTTALTAELTARKQQYEYYRNLLLTPAENTPVMRLGEIGTVKMCKRILKSQTSTDGDVPFYKIGTFGKAPDAYISRELYEEYKSKYSHPSQGDVLISCSGTIGRAVVYDGKPAYFQDSNIVWLEHDRTKVLNKYLAYCYERKPWKISEGGTIARLYNDNILQAQIPVPPLDVQERIVQTLESFEVMCTDLTSGLPAEIEVRRKQYEYYRDKLLTFTEKDN